MGSAAHTAPGAGLDPLAVLNVFRSIADTLAQDATQAKDNWGTSSIGSFYIHLHARLVLVSGHVSRVGRDAFSASDLCDELLRRLEELVRREISPDSLRLSASTATPHRRLNALLDSWSQPTQSKLDIGRHVDFDHPRQR